MSLPLVLVIPVVGVAALSVADRGPALAAAGAQSAPMSVPSGAPNYGTQPARTPVSAVRAPALVSALGKVNPYVTAGAGIYTTASQTTTTQTVGQLEQSIKAEWDKLTVSAKKAGAVKLSNMLGLSPPLTGAESWSTIVARTSKAAGIAACSSVPGVASAAALCGIAAAFLGKSAHEMLAKAYPYLKTAAQETWDAVKDAGGAVGDAAETILGWMT